MSEPMKLETLRKLMNRKDFLEIEHFSKEQIMGLIEFALHLKKMQADGVAHRYLEGKTLAMIFEKSSTRTRVSFETGMYQLGGTAQFLSRDDLQLGNGETVGDTAQVLARYVDYIMVRTFGHHIVDEMAEFASIPVINGLTDEAHPCQVLADLMTIYERHGTFSGLKFAYVGDGNNMINSLMIGCAIMGMDCHIATPVGAEVRDDYIRVAEDRAAVSGASIVIGNDAEAAALDADFIYTDVWTSMGWEGDVEARVAEFSPYQVNESLVKHAKADYAFMHCLPAKRGEEVTNEVIDSENSVVFDQAENRLHAQKAILCGFIGE